jgi:hypothetical protein
MAGSASGIAHAQNCRADTKCGTAIKSSQGLLRQIAEAVPCNFLLGGPQPYLPVGQVNHKLP